MPTPSPTPSPTPDPAPRPDSDRRSVIEGRVFPGRRAAMATQREADPAPIAKVSPDAEATGLNRRRGPGRRLSDFTRAAEEGQLTREQFLFLMAIDAFKKANGRHYPTWTDVLEVVRLLGYRKTMPMEMTLPAGEDWRESPNAPSNVRPERWSERAA